VDWIERRLAHAVGQSEKHTDAILANLAFNLNWCGGAIRQRYVNHPILGRYLLDERAQPPQGTVGLAGKDDASLSAQQTKLVSDHVPLFKSIARQFAGKRDWLRDDLETHGMEKLVSLVRDYDSTRGVTFGAFAKRRLMGAMRDYLKNHPRTISIEPEQIDIALRDKTRKLPKQKSDGVQTKHWSMGDKRLDKLSDGKSALWQRDRERYASSYWDRKELDKQTARFVTAGGIIKRYGEPCIPEYLKGPLEKLKHKQRVVYIGTVLTDPPVTRYRLALELGIRDVTQISRIKRQAERKMAGLLKPKVSP
jgi:Sigma-70 region 2